MNIRQWIGMFIALAGGFGISKHNGIEYLTASIMCIIIGMLLWFIPARKKKDKR